MTLKPSLRMTLMQLDPLPDPEEVVPEIEKSQFYIQCCPDATPADIPSEWLDLWSIDEENLPHITGELERLTENDLHYSLTISLMIFFQIYLRYYPMDDFADFGNFIYTFCRFQKFLGLIKRIKEISSDSADSDVGNNADTDNPADGIYDIPVDGTTAGTKKAVSFGTACDFNDSSAHNSTDGISDTDKDHHADKIKEPTPFNDYRGHNNVVSDYTVDEIEKPDPFRDDRDNAQAHCHIAGSITPGINDAGTHNPSGALLKNVRLFDLENLDDMIDVLECESRKG